MAYRSKKLTKKKLDYLIKDEAMAYEEYKRLGFPNLAKDEKEHEIYLKKIKRRMG